MKLYNTRIVAFQKDKKPIKYNREMTKSQLVGSLENWQKKYATLVIAYLKRSFEEKTTFLRESQ